MTVKPKNEINLTDEEISDLLDRLENHSLKEDDYQILIKLIKTLLWLNQSLKDKNLTIRRLRSMFNIKTETAERLFGLGGRGKPPKNPSDNAKDSSSSDKDNASDSDSENETPKGHGHRAASEYQNAKITLVAHETLKKGSLCPDCQKGKLFQLSPGTVLHIVGAPCLQMEIYKPERLRCSLCGKIFKAVLPEDLMKGSRAGDSAKVIVSLLKYRGGLPFYRQEKMQEMMGTPLSASSLWEMTKDLSENLLPIYASLCTEAAKGKILQNDDTTAKILSLMKERKEAEGTEKEEKRKGTFTTGILSTLDNDVQVALFFTGKKHAGENLADLLNERPEGLEPPIQQCDGSKTNYPKGQETYVANCASHARREFYDLSFIHPEVVLRVIGWFSKIFYHDKKAPEDPEERLKWHQQKSAPIMEEMKTYCNQLIENKEVEPNSSLGKAIGYLNNQWDGLTLFLRKPGVPLTNNATERLLKVFVLNRKNAYFYKTESGAKIGDTIMSVIETCILNEVNPWDYLLAIQKHEAEVKKNPEDWLPWKYQEAI